VDRALLRFDGFSGDSVGGVPYGGDSVRGSGLTHWAVDRGSAFEAGIIVVSAPAALYVLLRASEPAQRGISHIEGDLYGPGMGEVDGRDYDPSRNYVCDRREG